MVACQCLLCFPECLSSVSLLSLYALSIVSLLSLYRLSVKLQEGLSVRSGSASDIRPRTAAQERMMEAEAAQLAELPIRTQ